MLHARNVRARSQRGDIACGDSRRAALFLPTNRQLPLCRAAGQPQNYIMGLWRVSNDFQAPVVADVYLRRATRIPWWDAELAPRVSAAQR